MNIEKPSDIQVGGSHYKDLPIQPVEFCQRNRLGYCESAAIKYLSRWRAKGGKQDLEKARHYIDLLIEIEFPNSHHENQPTDSKAGEDPA